MAELTEFLANNHPMMNDPINLKSVNFNIPQQLVGKYEDRTVKNVQTAANANEDSTINKPHQTTMQLSQIAQPTQSTPITTYHSGNQAGNIGRGYRGFGYRGTSYRGAQRYRGPRAHPHHMQWHNTIPNSTPPSWNHQSGMHVLFPSFTYEKMLKLEKLFLYHTACMPTEKQVKRWSNNLGLNRSHVWLWFRWRWDAKLEYERSKLRLRNINKRWSEDNDATPITFLPTREPKSFEVRLTQDAVIMPPPPNNPNGRSNFVVQYENGDEDFATICMRGETDNSAPVQKYQDSDAVEEDDDDVIYIDDEPISHSSSTCISDDDSYDDVSCSESDSGSCTDLRQHIATPDVCSTA